MQNFIEFSMKYPFSIEAKNIISKTNFDIIQVNKELKNHFKKVIRILESILNGKNLPYFISNENYLSHLLLYPITNYILDFINNKFLTNKYAEGFANRCYFYLNKNSTLKKKKKTKIDKESLLLIAKNTFNWDLHELTNDSLFDWKIRFDQYLAVSTTFKDENYDFVYSSIKNGYVFLDTMKLVRLVKEKIREIIINRNDNQNLKRFLDVELLLLINSLKSKVNKYQEEMFKKFDIPIKIDKFPPCVLSLIEKAKIGMNIGHHARLFLAMYLNFAKLSIDEIIAYFILLPDFNDKITQYQLEKIQQKQLKPYNCSKLVSLGLCFVNNDEICKQNIKNPMVYSRKKTKKEMKK